MLVMMLLMVLEMMMIKAITEAAINHTFAMLIVCCSIAS
jgi:hypothetical protein